MSAWQICFSVGLVITSVYAVWGYPRKYGALSGRSRFYRTVGIGIILLLLVLALLGTYINFASGVTVQVGRIRELLWWATCFVLAISLPLVAILDALETYVTARREKRAFIEQAIREEIEKAQARKSAQLAATGPTTTVTPQTPAATVEQRVGGN